MAIKYKVNVNHINVQAAPTAKVIESELATNYRYLKRMKVSYLHPNFYCL
jgi:hypothetical protein